MIHTQYFPLVRTLGERWKNENCSQTQKPSYDNWALKGYLYSVFLEDAAMPRLVF